VVTGRSEKWGRSFVDHGLISAAAVAGRPTWQWISSMCILRPKTLRCLCSSSDAHWCWLVDITASTCLLHSCKKLCSI
jgi:hypothetical protein